MKKFAVLGSPILHSLSPRIHQLFAKQFNISLDYQAIHCKVDQFDQTTARFFKQGGCGLNITLPLKESAYQLASRLTKQASRCGAINTLWMNEDVLWGDNTDGAGFLADVQSAGADLLGKRVLIIGAGGAARGVLPKLIESGVSYICVVNRSKKRAVQLAAAYQKQIDMVGVGFDELEKATFDVVVNASSSSLYKQIPAIHAINVNQAFCYDMFYAKQPTIFLDWCQQNGASHTQDGLGMLVGQAAESFFIWHGVRPNVSRVLDQLRTNL